MTTAEPPQPEPQERSVARWPLAAALLAVLLGVALFAPRGDTPTVTGGESTREASGERIYLTYRQPDAPDREAEVAWSEGQTVADATRAASVPTAWRGEGEMAFLEAVDGLPNQGLEGLNWQFEVNGVYATTGAGATRLEPGDRVLWKLAPYE